MRPKAFIPANEIGWLADRAASAHSSDRFGGTAVSQRCENARLELSGRVLVSSHQRLVGGRSGYALQAVDHFFPQFTGSPSDFAIAGTESSPAIFDNSRKAIRCFDLRAGL